jgi:predicted nucleic acid-binding Zn ribbon protein
LHIMATDVEPRPTCHGFLCGRAVIPPRRKYCSPECAALGCRPNRFAAYELWFKRKHGSGELHRMKFGDLAMEEELSDGSPVTRGPSAA